MNAASEPPTRRGVTAEQGSQLWKSQHVTQFLLGQKEFDAFANLSGDDNPIHVDPEFSKKSRFGKTVSHGMLLFTLARGALENCLPQFQLCSQSLMFPAPCYAGEALSCTVDVEAEADGLVQAHICIRAKSRNVVVLEGIAQLSRAGLKV